MSVRICDLHVRVKVGVVESIAVDVLLGRSLSPVGYGAYSRANVG